MRGKCLECENYYLRMSYQICGQGKGDGTHTFLQPEADDKVVTIHGCNNADVVGMYVPGGHPFTLDAKGKDIEVLECNGFEPKKKK